MGGSLRDQLLALGMGSKPKEQQSNPERRATAQRAKQTPAKPQGVREPDLAQAYALRARAEKEERERAQQAAQEQARLKRERKQRLAQLLHGQALNVADAEQARHFEHGAKIRRIYVTEEQLAQLNGGALGVVQLAGRYLLVSRAVALAAQAVAAESLVLLPDPNATADDDVPADWVG